MENERLEALMDAASRESMEAARDFFEELLKAELFVPSRFQEQPLSDAPEYPNPFFNLLGVQAPDAVFIPVFTCTDYLEDWAGMPMAAEKITGAKLVEKVPEEWWVTINPDQEVGKELSPWEIDLLRGGEIDAIIEELESCNSEPVTFTATEDSEEVELKQLLRQIAEQQEEVVRLYLAKCVSEDDSFNLMLGIECDKPRSDMLRYKFETTIAPSMIGKDPLQIYINDPESMMFGLFKQLSPFYERTSK